MNLVTLKKSLHPIFQQHRIEKAILFGSFAREEDSSRSDIDLILIKKTNQRFLDRYDQILVDLSEIVPNYEIDIFIYTPDELERIAERPFIAQALREGKILYESK